MAFSEDPTYPRIVLFAKLGGLSKSEFYHPGLAQLCFLPALSRFFGNPRKLESSFGDGTAQTPIRSEKAFFKATLSAPRSRYPIPAAMDTECRSKATEQFDSGFDAAILPLLPIWRLYAVQENIRLRNGVAALKQCLKERTRALVMEKIGAEQGPNHSWHMKLLGIMRASHLPERDRADLALPVSVGKDGGFDQGDGNEPSPRHPKRPTTTTRRIGSIALPRIRRGNLLIKSGPSMPAEVNALPCISQFATE